MNDHKQLTNNVLSSFLRKTAGFSTDRAKIIAPPEPASPSSLTATARSAVLRGVLQEAQETEYRRKAKPRIETLMAFGFLLTPGFGSPGGK